jgi:hypothetical protein
MRTRNIEKLAFDDKIVVPTTKTWFGISQVVQSRKNPNEKTVAPTTKP